MNATINETYIVRKQMEKHYILTKTEVHVHINMKQNCLHNQAMKIMDKKMNLSLVIIVMLLKIVMYNCLEIRK